MTDLPEVPAGVVGGDSSYKPAVRKQLTAVLDPKADAVMGSLRMHQMHTFNDRLRDIEQAERKGRHRHFRLLAELLAGAVAGAFVTSGTKHLVHLLLLLLVALLFYLASVSIQEAHADSVAGFRRDFKRVMDNIQFVEAGEAGEGEGEGEGDSDVATQGESASTDGG